ncbi:tRNA (adenosine(37)-N6)-threonylcarbamoyltransferase complex dimerization subunit type 1 TsaB [Echinicola shivajiensis]|uniref:tRNA (adenosine(37)-N6)-threonylcarbamoyltransferase complex dimerization subunit type 1 TsaB n=1 Tax=Echinicola shivajiensis TaxID=1035916 RepID=UPI001BFC62B5|nr:tRNA (adenosine(37)-N6)-threonylcarbamoyltransferase complex dimerization subunit type 1 TsaB [Echinicola shivajiensis]
MGLILSIDTAVSVCSVALHQDGQLLALLELHQENVHAQKLMPAIKELMEQAGVQSSQLDAVAVSEGPGSYTGLRIGVSTAKGISFAHNIPLIGVGSLDALAYQVRRFAEEGTVIVPMIDARRMEVYSKVFNSSLAIIEEIKPEIIDESSYKEYLKNGLVYFLGDGAQKVSEVIMHSNARFFDITNSAVSVGGIAHEKFEREEFVDIAYFEPNYLKEFRVVKSKKNPLLS